MKQAEKVEWTALSNNPGLVELGWGRQGPGRTSQAPPCAEGSLCPKAYDSQPEAQGPLDI